jgi:hypothetical protein
MKKLLLTVLTLNALVVSPVYAMNTEKDAAAAVQLRHEPTATVEKLEVMAVGGLSAMAIWIGGIYIYRSIQAQMPWAMVGGLFVAAGAYGLASAVLKMRKDHQN